MRKGGRKDLGSLTVAEALKSSIWWPFVFFHCCSAGNSHSPEVSVAQGCAARCSRDTGSFSALQGSAAVWEHPPLFGCFSPCSSMPATTPLVWCPFAAIDFRVASNLDIRVLRLSSWLCSLCRDLSLFSHGLISKRLTKSRLPGLPGLCVCSVATLT